MIVKLKPDRMISRHFGPKQKWPQEKSAQVKSAQFKVAHLLLQ